MGFHLWNAAHLAVQGALVNPVDAVFVLWVVLHEIPMRGPAYLSIPVQHTTLQTLAYWIVPECSSRLKEGILAPGKILWMGLLPSTP